MTDSIKPFKEQDYQQLKQSHDSDNLFEDPHFLPKSKSMYFSKQAPAGTCTQFIPFIAFLLKPVVYLQKASHGGDPRLDLTLKRVGTSV